MLLGFIVLLAAVILLIIKYITGKRKSIIALFVLPTLLFVLIITKIAPFIELRYVMCLLPIISICAVLGIDGVIKNKILTTSIIAALTIAVSVYGFLNYKPDFLYVEYADNINVAKEYKDLPFVYVGDTMFNHISSIPEFMIYGKTLLLGDNELDRLKGDSTLENANAFILSIKAYKNVDEILKTVLSNTNYTKYEMLLDGLGYRGC